MATNNPQIWVTGKAERLLTKDCPHPFVGLSELRLATEDELANVKRCETCFTLERNAKKQAGMFTCSSCHMQAANSLWGVTNPDICKNCEDDL